MNWKTIEPGDVLLHREKTSDLWFYYIVTEKLWRSDYADVVSLVLNADKTFSIFSVSSVAAVNPCELLEDGTPKFVLLKAATVSEALPSFVP